MIVIVIIAIFAFSIFAVVNISWITNVLKETTDEKMYNETEKFSNQISMIFENAEGAVDSLCADIKNTFDVYEQKQDKSYIERYIKKYDPVFRDSLVDIEDAIGLYMTFDPELANWKGAYEIWYSYDKTGRIKLTDALNNGVYLEAFEDVDAPNMQYYFDAVKNPNNGIWTTPSMDPDINEMTISYSRSAYHNNDLIGVVGTDISTDHTTDVINDLDIGDDGAVLLLNKDNEPIISGKGAEAMKLMNSDEFRDLCQPFMKNKQDGMFSITWNGEQMKTSFSTLSNDWILALVENEKTLYMPVNFTRTLIIVLCTILALLSIVAIYLLLRKVSDPMNKAVNLLKGTVLDEHMEAEDTANVTNEDDLEYLVQKAVEKQRISDIMLANQSKLASVGEMMSNVTHQWKQPLNSINIIMGNLKDDIKYGEFNEQKTKKAVEKVESLAQTMSSTINDFSNYLKPDSTLDEFVINDVIIAALGIVEEKMKMEKIQAEFRPEDTYVSFGHKNALFHVILNILTNAIEAIQESEAKDGKIQISIKRYEGDSGKIYININNNGPHMDPHITANMFKPYYSTKTDGSSSGLGLFISKTLIEESMNGVIDIKNVETGVLCSILIDGQSGGEDGKS